MLVSADTVGAEDDGYGIDEARSAKDWVHQNRGESSYVFVVGIGSTPMDFILFVLFLAFLVTYYSDLDLQ